MSYLYAIAGFICGFAVGIFVIGIFLRNYKAKELLENKSLRYTYGLAVWLFASIGAWLGLWLYSH